MTQTRLAEELGYGQEYVSRVERGKRPPSWRFLAAFAALMHVPVEDLLRAAGLAEQPEIDEVELASLVAAHPDLEAVFLYARQDPSLLKELARFARMLVAEKQQAEKQREQGGGTPAASRGPSD